MGVRYSFRDSGRFMNLSLVKPKINRVPTSVVTAHKIVDQNLAQHTSWPEVAKIKHAVQDEKQV